MRIKYQTFHKLKTVKECILQKVISIWMQLCSIAHFFVIKIRMGAISSAVSSAADSTNSNFDDKEMGNWIELHSYWNYFLQNTILSQLSWILNLFKKWFEDFNFRLSSLHSHLSLFPNWFIHMSTAKMALWLDTPISFCLILIQQISL